MAAEKLAQVIDFQAARREWNWAIQSITERLLDRAAEEGAFDLVRLCKAALSKTPSEGRRIARRACVEILRNEMHERNL